MYEDGNRILLFRGPSETFSEGHLVSEDTHDAVTELFYDKTQMEKVICIAKEYGIDTDTHFHQVDEVIQRLARLARALGRKGENL